MKIILQSVRLLLVLTILTGVLYPLAVTFMAHAAWSEKSEGSLLMVNGKCVGSEWLAQKNEDPRYFWSRPSAADYATVASGASNLGPGSAALQKLVQERSEKWRSANDLGQEALVPLEMVYASGSGLDPHISPLAAAQQLARVAKARHFSTEKTQQLEALVRVTVELPQFGVLGDARVNVLMLNIALDRL